MAVYGTLKRGQRSHYWLEGADFLGSDRLTSATLYDLGPAWLYLYNPEVVGCATIRQGGWWP